MNMTLSKRGDYVMRAAIALARAFDSGAPRKIREVVADTEMPQTFASQILADLVRGGLAQSKAGRDGGYWLVRPPADISVLEVIEAAEGPLRADRCALGEGPCRWEAVCPLHETWSEVTVLLRESLAATSLAEVAERDAALEAGVYQVPSDSHRLHPVAVKVSDLVQVELPAARTHDALLRSRGEVAELLAAALAAEEGPDAAADAASQGRSGRPAVEASLVPPSSGSPGPGDSYLLGWRASGGAGVSRFEGELSVEEVDSERSQLRLEGTWRQESDSRAALTGPELERRARSVLRSLLRRFAWSFEAPEGLPGEQGPGRRPRPQRPRAASAQS